MATTDLTFEQVMPITNNEIGEQHKKLIESVIFFLFLNLIMFCIKKFLFLNILFFKIKKFFKNKTKVFFLNIIFVIFMGSGD